MDQSFVRRVKTLARTAPVHELEAAKAKREGDWSVYDLRALTLAAIDAVIDHMGLEHGAGAGTVLDRLAWLARLAAPERGAEEHRSVAEAVLGSLLNDRRRREAFSVPYGDFNGAGPRMAELVFKLLEEVEAPDGTIVLRASDEAVNLFVGALDRDVEDAQAAAEAVLQSQLRRGRIDQAILTAKEARLRSVQFATKVRRILESTRRDIRQVDWSEDAPRLLRESLEHLGERLDVERQLLATLNDTLEAAQGSEDARTVAELLRIVTECQGRHTDLHKELIAARSVFLEEQSRQRFRPAATLVAVALEDDLLKPLFGADLPAAEAPAVAFLSGAVGAVAHRLLRVADLVALLLRAPRREEEAPPDEAPDLVLEELDPLRFPDDVRRLAEGVLAGLDGEGVRLSALLGSARHAGEAVAELVALTALRAFAPEGETEPLLASDDGALLDDAVFGGSDLLLELAEMGGGER